MAETSYIIQNGRRLNLKDSTARKSIGSCDELQTETKHCLVMAINELCQKVEGGGSGGGGDGKDGKDGYSPTIEVIDIDGGHRLTITDVNGTKTVDVLDGEAGVGISSVFPIHVDTASGAVSTYGVELDNGDVYSFDVFNGEKGDKGDPGTGVDVGLSVVAGKLCITYSGEASR